MSAGRREENIVIMEADRSGNMTEGYVSVSEALKLVTPFTCNK
jgi:hypothetical protein